LSATAYHTAEFFYEPLNRISQPGYTTLAARASWTFGESNFKLSAWGRNLTNKEYLQGAFPNQIADGLQFAPPRTYGVTADYSF
jgi:iron complex outermembrane recepter protein